MKKINYRALTASDKALEIIRRCFEDEKKGNRNARNDIKEDLKAYFIRTEDGSYTLNSNGVSGKSEMMHTYHGAVTESLEKFVKPAQLEGKKEVRIMDICSGLGYNAAACIENLDDSVKIDIDMIEISKETLQATLLIENPIESYEIIKGAIESELFKRELVGFKFHQEKINERININIYIDDARNVVKKITDKRYDAVFLDPFSPLKSPELYSLEFFIALKNLLKENGLILTYTSAAPVRSAMVLAGLHIGEGPQFGRKSGGTIASKSSKMIQTQLSDADERMIALSDAGIPFRDPELNGSGEKIIEGRENERKSVRGNSKIASTVKTPVFLNEEVENSRLKRRILRNIEFMGIDDLKSPEARFIICPQYEECICKCGNSRLEDSKSRINEMIKRLSIIIEKCNDAERIIE